MVELMEVALEDGKERLNVFDDEESADMSEDLVISGSAT